MEPYKILSGALAWIEDNIKTSQGDMDYVDAQGFSHVHLRRLFRFAFGRGLCGYIRSRKLTASLEPLFQSEMRIIDIAEEYGFEYEQSYIRAFKREFGVTPGECREAGQSVRATPPLHLFPKNDAQGDLLFGPELVMTPTLHFIGRRHKISFAESTEMAPIVGQRFWREERFVVSDALEPNIYYGLTRIPDFNEGWSWYLPSVRVKAGSRVPVGFTEDAFPASLCVRFRYVGNHHYYDINKKTAGAFYERIAKLMDEVGGGYALGNRELYFEKIDTDAYDGRFSQLEWFTPVRVKNAAA